VHRRSLILIAVVAIILLAGTAGGIVAASAQGGSLSTITPAKLIANVAQHAEETTSISGNITWKNNLLGLSMLSFGGQGAGDLTSLLSGGEGRLWLQGGKLRAEIQGAMGDTVVSGNAETGKIWLYSSGKNTATEYSLPTKPAGADATTLPSAATSAKDPVAAIEQFIEKMAPVATLAVNGEVEVAGRNCYVLSIIPKADNTILGSAQVAIDGDTYVPLKLDLYAKATADPVLTVGFAKVSYDEIGTSVFEFTPPANATVEHKELTLPDFGFGEDSGGSSHQDVKGNKPVELSLAEAAAKAGFTPPAAQSDDPNLAFAGAYVIPAKELDLSSLLGVLGGAGSAGSGFALPSLLPQELTSAQMTLGPTVIQRYGQGLGSVVLIEMKTPALLSAQLEQLLNSVPLFSRTTAGGITITQFNTALSSAALWSRDGLLILAAGSVSQTDLMEFIASVR
jgi:outer membrane lipoprotein-sorting protein